MDNYWAFLSSIVSLLLGLIALFISISAINRDRRRVLSSLYKKIVETYTIIDSIQNVVEKHQTRPISDKRVFCSIKYPKSFLDKDSDVLELYDDIIADKYVNKLHNVNTEIKNDICQIFGKTNGGFYSWANNYDVLSFEKRRQKYETTFSQFLEQNGIFGYTIGSQIHKRNSTTGFKVKKNILQVIIGLEIQENYNNIFLNKTAEKLVERYRFAKKHNFPTWYLCKIEKKLTDVSEYGVYNVFNDENLLSKFSANKWKSKKRRVLKKKAE